MRHLTCLMMHGVGTIHEASNLNYTTLIQKRIVLENLFHFLCIMFFDIFYEVWTTWKSRWSFLGRKGEF